MTLLRDSEVLLSVYFEEILILIKDNLLETKQKLWTWSLSKYLSIPVFNPIRKEELRIRFSE